jgi:hypothetical protein
MTAAQQLKEIKGILNTALAPTIRIKYGKRKGDETEYPMTQVDRVQWLAEQYREARRELESIAEDAAGEDL